MEGGYYYNFDCGGYFYVLMATLTIGELSIIAKAATQFNVLLSVLVHYKIIRMLINDFFV